MRALIGCLLLAVLLPSANAAQQIRGFVVEDSTGLPIADAKVELVGADTLINAMAMSVTTGWFQFYTQSPGQFLVVATHSAYKNLGSLVVTVGAQETITVVLRLSGGPIPLEPLVVNAVMDNRLRGFRERERRRASGHFITRSDIDKLGGYHLTQVLRLTPEVRVERIRDGGFTSDGVFMRSFGDMCVPAVYLDGTLVPNGMVFDINAMLSPDAVEGIEVYRSAISAPMEFRTPSFMESGRADFSCGIIAVWSRPLPRGRFPAKGMLLSGLLAGTTLVLGKLLR